MKTSSVSAVLAALMLAGLAVDNAAAAEKAKGPALGPAVGKVIQDEQKLEKAGDLKSALDKLHEAQALPNHSPYEDFVINSLLAEVSFQLKDMPTVIKAYEAMADSPDSIPDENKAQVFTNAVLLEASTREFQKAIKYADELAKLGPLPDKVLVALAQCYYFTNDFVRATDLAKKAIATAKAANQLPDKSLLQILLNSQTKAGQKAEAFATLEELATDYGQPDDWGTLIGIALGTKADDIIILDLLRLGAMSGANLGPSDYTMMASVALHKGLPGDAVTAAQHGGSAPDARAKAAADQKSLPAQEAAGKTQGGEYNVKLAEDYLGYGRYVEAEAAARRALAKGGAKDPGEPHMVIGIALVGQGKYADAQQAFQQVTGGPAAIQAARLWSDFVKYKTNAANPAPAAPAH